MQKKLFLLMLLVASIALSGCALVVKDPVRDAQQVSWIDPQIGMDLPLSL